MTASPKKSFSLSTLLEHLKTPPIPYSRLTLVCSFLVLGSFLIETHPTLNHSLIGILLWGIAVYLIQAWFPPVPGLNVFSGSPLQNLKGEGEWDWKLLSGVCLGVLALIALSNHFIHHSQWFGLLVALLILGFLLSKLEKHSPAFWAEPVTPASTTGGRIPWPTILILLVGSFFLFYGWDLFPIGHNLDGYTSIDLAYSFLKDPQQDGSKTTPYMDGWSLGNPSLPFFLIGLFFKVVGVSLQKGVLFIALVNLAGYFFFYGFLRFYLPKPSALVTTLLLASSHWVIYFGREVTGGIGLMVPMECALLYFFARALEKGNRGDFALFGTLLAATLMAAVQGRVYLVFFVLSLAGLWLFRRAGILQQKNSWIMAWAVALLWYLPMILYYQHTSNPYCFGAEEFGRDSTWQGGKFSIPWNNIQATLQMFNVRSTDNLTEFLPRLSPWEGLMLLAGFGWCLWRFFTPPVLFLMMGFALNLAPGYMSNSPTIPWRILSVAPFAYLIVGIGLDRLSKVIASHLGSKGRTLQTLFLAAFLAFSMGWQYDVFFHRLPMDKGSYWLDGGNRSGEHYNFGKISAQYVKGWDTYVDVKWGIYNQFFPEGGFSLPFSEVQASLNNRIIFKPDPLSLPLKKVSEKGAVLLFHDEVGKALQDWIQFYYPEARSKVILNPFGDVEMRLWEITPDQIQKALSQPLKPPPGGVVLSWFDAQNHPLGKLVIPTLWANALNLEWLIGDPLPTVPWGKTAYFTVQGMLENPDGKLLAIETAGKAEGVIGGQGFKVEGLGNMKRVEVRCASKNSVPFKIRYVAPNPGNFDLSLLEHTALGWDMIPSSELKL